MNEHFFTIVYDFYAVSQKLYVEMNKILRSEQILMQNKDASLSFQTVVIKVAQ